jgi:hypothetical protein
LSDLNRAKKSVNRDYAKQYQAQDGAHDNLGQLQDVDAIFNTLSTRLTSLYSALQDFSEVLNAPLAILLNPIASLRPANIANLQQFGGRILNEIRSIQTIMSRIKNFNLFTPDQSAQLSQYVTEIQESEATIYGASQMLGTSPTAVRIDELIQMWKGEYDYLMQFLTGSTANYRALEMKGGAIVPAYNGEGRFGSDGYRVGDYYSYTDPRRFF